MKYTFAIKENIHMYNHLLTVSDGRAKYEAIVESAPLKKKTVIIWLEDFGLPEEELDSVKAEMTEWFSARNTVCIFNRGKGR